MKRYTALFLALIIAVCAVPMSRTNAAETFSISEIAQAGYLLANQINSQKSVPNQVTIAKTQIPTPEYLYLATTAVVNINNGVLSDIEAISVDPPGSSSGEEVDADIGKADYVDLAERVKTFAVKNKVMPNYGTTPLGRLNYETMTYLFARLMVQYLDYVELPPKIQVIFIDKADSNPTFAPIATPGSNEGATGIDFGAVHVAKAAAFVIHTVKQASALPRYVTINAVRVSMPELIWLMFQYVVNMDHGDAADIAYVRFADPENRGESITTGNMARAEYVSLAASSLAYMNASGMAPSYVSTSLGQMGFENLVYTFAQLCNFGAVNAQLPGNVTVDKWSQITSGTVPAPGPTTAFTPKPIETPAAEKPSVTVNRAAVLSGASRLKAFVDFNKELPRYMMLGSKRVSMEGLLSAFVMTVIDVSMNTAGDITLPRLQAREQSAEALSSGTLSRPQYIKIARDIKNSMIAQQIAPSYVATPLGEMSFETALYFYASLVTQAKSSYELPSSAAVKSWAELTNKTLPTPGVTSNPTPRPTPTPYSGTGAMPGDDFARGSVGINGAVSSGTKVASQVGINVLKAGGNAIDAAVATIFAVGLTQPCGSGVGGGGLSVIYLAEEDKYIVFDYMSQTPSNVGGSGRAARVAIPGIVHGAISMLEKYGTMTLDEILSPIIEIARNGFEITDYIAYKFTLVPSTYSYALGLYRNNGELYKKGDIFKNNDLANTLELIRDQGISGFYNSAFTDQMCDYLQSIGGTITRADFAQYTSLERDPNAAAYRGYQVYAGSGTAQGGLSMINMLNNMSKHDLAVLGHDNPETVRITAGAFGIRPSGSMNEAITDDPYNEAWYDTKSTTMLVTYDQYGNMVASNNTLGDNFGSGVAVPGTGFCFNSGMGTSTGVPLSRIQSTMAPAIVAHRDGTPMLGVGSPGNSAIITATAITISNVIDFGMNISQAINAPRFFGSGSSLTIENRYSSQTLAALSSMGFRVSSGDSYSDGVGCIAAIYVGEDGVIYGGADNRREYMSYAY